MYLRRLIVRSWLTEEGSKILGRQLASRIPDRPVYFMTLTVDPGRVDDDPHLAYTWGSAALPRLIRRLRRVYPGIHHYLWRLEFHKSGFPHWHVLLDASQMPRMSVDAWCGFIKEVSDTWGLCPSHGVDVKYRQAGDVLNYVSKYVSKAGVIPEYLHNEYKIRMFSSSRGYLLNAKPDDDDDDDVPSVDDVIDVDDDTESSLVLASTTIGDRLKTIWSKAVLCDELDLRESTVRVYVTLPGDFFDLLLLAGRAGYQVDERTISLMWAPEHGTYLSYLFASYRAAYAEHENRLSK